MSLSNSTTSLESEISSLTVSPGTAACVWLGQGGYLFKSPQGLTVMVDAYLTDYAEAFWGVTRAIPPVVDPQRFAPDVFLTTHWHEDHLDAPTVRHYARQPDVTFGGPESCVMRAQIWGWPAERTVAIDRGDSRQFGDVADSEYDARLRPMWEHRIDVMLVPINGVGGNMNAHEAALLAWQVAPRIAVPMHYGMWPAEQYGPGATLDPETFRDTLTRLGSETAAQVLEPGEITLFLASRALASRL